MSDLDKVVALSLTVACTVGLEPLMFPTGLAEVMVTRLEPPPPVLPRGLGLVLRLDLCAFRRLLDLPTSTPFHYQSRSMLSYLALPETMSRTSK